MFTIKNRLIEFCGKLEIMSRQTNIRIVRDLLQTTDRIINAELNMINNPYNETDKRNFSSNTGFNATFNAYYDLKYEKDEIKRNFNQGLFEICISSYGSLHLPFQNYIWKQIEMCDLRYQLTSDELTNMLYVERHTQMYIWSTFKFWKNNRQKELEIISLFTQLTNDKMSNYDYDNPNLSLFAGEARNMINYTPELGLSIINKLRWYFKYINTDIRTRIVDLLFNVWYLLLNNMWLCGVIYKEINECAEYELINYMSINHNSDLEYILKKIKSSDNYLFVDKSNRLLHYLIEINETNELNDRFHLYR